MKRPFKTEIVQINEWINDEIKSYFNPTGLIHQIFETPSTLFVCFIHLHPGYISQHLEENWWHPEADLLLFAKDSATSQLWCSVLHSAASAKWQQSPSTGKNLVPRKCSSYFINSFEPTCLSFSTYLLVLPSPLLCMSSTAWKVCQIWGILIHLFPTLFLIFGKNYIVVFPHMLNITS